MPTREPQFAFTNGRSRRSIRRAYLIANAFELFVAALAMIAAITYALDPTNLSDGSIGHLQFPDLLWNAMYGLGAALVTAGLVWISPRVEAMGLSLFAGSVVIQALAVGNLRGWAGASTIAIFVGFAAASLIRAWVLVRAVVAANAAARIRQEHADG